MRKSLFLFCFICISVNANDDFASFKNSFNKQQQDYNQKKIDHFIDFKAQYLQDYDNYRNALFSLWTNPIQSNINQQIIYADDKQSRIVINEQDKTLTLETIEPVAKNTLTSKSVNSLLNKALSDNPKLIEQLANSKPRIKKQTDVTNQQLHLAQEIQTQYEKQLSSIDASTQLTKAQRQKQKATALRSKNDRVQKLEQQLAGKKNLKYKNITSYQINLTNDYLYGKAAKYLGFYRQQNFIDHADLPLLLAISHAESAFNPKAISHIPAYGLMQIVRHSAGVDVAQQLFNKNRAPTEAELYDPQTNITFGAGYLFILKNKYLKDIKDPLSKKYCVIAAYNTGSGNVARAFNPKDRVIKNAIPHINALSSEQVYQQLIHSLPYDETKKYLKKVTKLEKDYQKTISNQHI